MPIVFECPECKLRQGRAIWLQDHLRLVHDVEMSLMDLYANGYKKNVPPPEQIKFDLDEQK